MKLKQFVFLITLMISFAVTSVSAQNGEHSWVNEDTVRSIVVMYQDLNSQLWVSLDSADMPENWYAIFDIDTTKGELLNATSYVYKGKYKYLTTYHFFNNKLLATVANRMLIKNQIIHDLKRECGYWNDSLIYVHATDNNFPDYRQDIRIAYELLETFKHCYATRKIYYPQKGHMAKFK